MPEVKGREHGPAGSSAHTQSDVDVGLLTWFAVCLIAIVASVALLTHFTLGRIFHQPIPGEARRSPLARETPPPEPRLQISPPGDMDALRAHDRAVLQSYGWVDRAHDTVRVPIDEAKKMVLEKGLPVR